LLQTLQTAFPTVSISIDSDRTGYILGECWQGAGQGYTDVIYLAVGTGIGAGILINGKVLQGAHGIAGAIGWMALDYPFREAFIQTGCFESIASGAGMVMAAQHLIRSTPGYYGALTQDKSPEALTARDLFEAYAQGDPIAREVIRQAIARWGMAVANLVSLFDPQKIILGGGVFGPATGLIPDIKAEAGKWAQPVSMQHVTIEGSALGDRAGLFGAAYLAINPSHANH
jgi:glucokinase